MPKFSPQTIDEINARTDMVALVSEYTRLERRGDEWWGCCPFHNEKTPSFHVNAERKMYHCFGCGAGGGLINFYMETEKVSYSDAVRFLAKKCGAELIYEGSFNAKNEKPEENKKERFIDLYGRVSGTYGFFLTSSDMGKKALDYLKARGVTDSSIEEFGLGFSPADRRWLKHFLRSKNYSDAFLEESGLFSKKYPDISFFSNRLMFPIWDRRGRVIAFGARLLEGEGPKYINSGDSVQYKKGETLYAFHLAKQKIRSEKAVILCEGYMDVIAYHQAGLKQAVAPLGTALTKEQIHMLSSFADTFYLSFDSDTAGQNATYKAILLCRKHGISVKIIVFDEGKDPAEILLKSGPETLTKHVENAILDSDFLLSALMRQYPAHTPEGKTKICLAYFPYLDALQSDIHRESCFEQLCQALQLKPEAVRADYENRKSGKTKPEGGDTEHRLSAHFKPNAEMRSVLAVIANPDYFSLMRSSLNADDFDDARARDMFVTLEECFREDAVSSDSILRRCSGEVRAMVTGAVTSGEFTLNSRQAVEDGIRLIRKNSLERRRDRIGTKIRALQGSAPDTRQELDALINEKMNIDFELQQLKGVQT
ncbi:DNA primase [Treponema sp. HNW]|uniref:DNA primase n=1 Tax=Treponema sp. HNW TaxID=3116654 RepID=UPI003D10DF44